MKKWISVFLTLVMVCTCCAALAERVPACYEYALTEEGAYVENLIFNEDVIISGDNSQIVFSNCEFNANIINTSNEGTRVLLLGCDVNGVCVLQNDIPDATIDSSMPKFLTTSPITAVTDGCSGTVCALGDFDVTFDGETYAMASCQYFSNATNPDAGMVPYEGQEASYHVVSKWYENGERVVFTMCEYDPEA